MKIKCIKPKNITDGLDKEETPNVCQSLIFKKHKRHAIFSIIITQPFKSNTTNFPVSFCSFTTEKLSMLVNFTSATLRSQNKYRCFVKCLKRKALHYPDNCGTFT